MTKHLKLIIKLSFIHFSKLLDYVMNSSTKQALAQKI